MDNKNDAPFSIGREYSSSLISGGIPEFVFHALNAARAAASEAVSNGFIDFSFTFTCKSRRHADAIEWWLKSHDIEVIIISPRPRLAEKIRSDTRYNCSARLPVFRKEWRDGE